MIFIFTDELPDIIKYNNYHVPYKPYHFDSTSSWTDVQKDHIIKQDNLIADKLLEVTVRLPANVCWWDEPEIVRWQPWEESPEFLELSKELQYYNLNFDKIELEKSMRLFNRIITRKGNNDDDVDIIEDFDLVNRTEDIRLFYVLTKYIIPKLSLTYRFDCELREEEEKLQLELKRREHIRREREEDIRIQNEAKELRRKEREEKKLLEMERLLLMETLEEPVKPVQATAESQVSTDELQTSTEPVEKSPEEPKASTDALVEDPVQETPSEETLEQEETEAEKPAEMGQIVQGTAARELLPTQDPTRQLQLEPPIHRETSESIMLSQLIESIELYNRQELPVFKDLPPKKQPKKGAIDEVAVPVEPLPVPLLRSTESTESTRAKKTHRKSKSSSSIVFDGTMSILPEMKSKWKLF